MIRSRVSFATGWMSEGRGPLPAMRAQIIRLRAPAKAKVRRTAACERIVTKVPGDALRQHRAAAPRDRGPHPRAALRGRVLGRHAAARQRRRRADLLRPLAARRRPRRCARPGQLGLGRAYVSGEIEVDDMDAVIELLDSWQPPSLDARRQGAPAARRGPRRRPPAAAEAAGRRAAAERPPPQQGARREGRAPPLRRLQRVLRALPRRVDDLQLRLLRRGRADAGGGPGGEARDGRPQAGAAGGRPGARRRLRLGQLPAAGGDRSTAPASSGSRSRRRRPSGRGGGPRRPASPTGSRSA